MAKADPRKSFHNNLVNLAKRPNAYFVLVNAALLAALFTARDAQSAPLAPAAQQLKLVKTEFAITQIGASKYRKQRPANRYRNYPQPFVGLTPSPGDRYRALEIYEDDYAGDYPPPPFRAFRGPRPNWYAPTATFRFMIDPW